MDVNPFMNMAPFLYILISVHPRKLFSLVKLEQKRWHVTIIYLQYGSIPRGKFFEETKEVTN